MFVSNANETVMLARRALFFQITMRLTSTRDGINKLTIS